MQEARASWNTIYQDEQGFECQMTLSDDDEIALEDRVAQTTSRILESGGIPVTRGGPTGAPVEEGPMNGSEPNGSRPVDGEDKTFVDGKGLRRCNLNLNNGRRCSQPVTEREGRYGLFWSCPRYREHTPVTANSY